MAHSTDITAAVTANEPANGTQLVVDNGSGDWKVIWRDDAEAKAWGVDWDDDDHWFSDPHSDPMELHQHIKYARAVYALGEQLAVFA